ncbi:hypothetical protein ACH5RR_036097 [Cinchona calisaya]|uniref:Uncharacterized protein n=1 Tax=Cinchona calisaya TaxID=153742 RepID=A0ABD2Y7Q6_9GENT
MQIAGHWWACDESSSNRFPDPAFYVLRGVLFGIYQFMEKVIVLLDSVTGAGIYFRISNTVRGCLGFMHHGSRLLGWWSIDESSREEQAHLYYARISELVFYINSDNLTLDLLGKHIL